MRIVRMLVPLLVVLVGCTPAQITAWVRWHNDDPEAATEYANRREVQAAFAESVGTDGPQFAQYLASYTPGVCDSYVPLFEEYGLPVATFKRIAWRESGCDHTSFVRDSDDLGGGLLGLNLRAGASRWFAWCGLTATNVTSAETNVACAAAAYQRMGMAPWGT